MGVPDSAEWFLGAGERGNLATSIPDWSAGNRVEPLIHGSTYFDRLATEVAALGRGDHLFFTDWRGDPDQRVRDAGPTIAELFSDAARRGVVVKGLVWRSHLDTFSYSEEENQHLGEAIEAAGGEVLLDQRVRFGGSHHQKLVVMRHPGDPDRDVAFAGGIDLCHSRRDDGDHRGDAQAVQMAAAYGPGRRGTTSSSGSRGRRSARWTPHSGNAGPIRRRWTCSRPSHGWSTSFGGQT